MKPKYPEGSCLWGTGFAPLCGPCLTLCYMETDCLIYDIETDDFYKDIAEDVKDGFNTSGYNPNGYAVPGLRSGPIDPYLWA